MSEHHCCDMWTVHCRFPWGPGGDKLISIECFQLEHLEIESGPLHCQLVTDKRAKQMSGKQNTMLITQFLKASETIEYSTKARRQRGGSL